MTVIMAASFRNGIAIAADTLFHDPSTMGRVMNAPKTLLVGDRVGMAQAGAFTLTSQIWSDLEKMNPANVTPKAVADFITVRATAIHSARGAVSLMLTGLPERG